MGPLGSMQATQQSATTSRSGERRRATTELRVSWAAPTPFEVAGDMAVDDIVRRADARRSSWIAPYVTRLLVTDAVLAAAVMASCLYSLPHTRPFTLALGVMAGLLWVVVLGLMGGYDRRRLGDGPDEFSKIGQAAVLVIALLSVVSYTFQLVLPRRDVLLAVPLIALLTLFGRYGWRRWLHSRRRQGRAMLRTLVVGEAAAVADVIGHLRRDHHHGIDVVGVCTPVLDRDTSRLCGVDPLGVLSEVPQVVVDHEIDNVVVVGSQITGESLRRLSWALEQTGADLMVAPGLVEVTGAYVSLHPTAGLSLLRVEKPAQRSGRLVVKSLQDRTLGLAMFVVALPVIAAAALAVRLTSQGPAFFSQQRIGQDGNPFTMWKLRSMVVDAEDRKGDLLAQSDRDGLMFKMRSDPRVTPVGSLLRRYSIDELPQLWNVVKGDMSLVGPRPPLPHEYEGYHDAIHRRLRVKPGLTGLWQVSGRADLSWDESVRLDLRYVDNWSPAMDLQILWKTARAVLVGSGAY